MFINQSPLFESGRVLKLQMLQNLRDFPRDILNILYQEYSNGILTGCNITTSHEYLIISPGIICYNHNLYLLNEPIKVDYQHNNQMTLLKVKFLGEERNKDFKSLITKIVLEETTYIRDNELELCRFKLSEEAKLRTNYQDFGDLNTQYNTINKIYAPYSAKEVSTISPEVLNFFAKEALNFQLTLHIDITFIMTILSAQMPLNRAFITTYISTRLQSNYQDASNIEIYQAMNKILKEIKGNKIQGTKKITNKYLLID